MFAFLAWSPTTLSHLLAAAYVSCGIAVATKLSRSGASHETALSALAVWPLLLPLLTAPPKPPTGPLGERIDRAFADLDRVLVESPSTPLDPTDLRALREALHRADERLALVDRWLERERQNNQPSALASLQEARQRSVLEIESVLGEMSQLRLQIGLLTLAGDGGAVQEQLSALMARVSALEELR